MTRSHGDAASLQADVSQQLVRVLSSPGFARNERMCRFLRFLVARHLAGKDDELKESVIAVEVFGRRPDYDPKVDSIVRTEAGRLRARLVEYYAAAGRSDPIVIHVPKGRYVPSLDRRVVGRPTRSRRRWVIGAVAFASLVLGSLAWRSPRHDASPIPIAVLPLRNLSTEPDGDNFADALTDEIIRNLSVIDGLAVRSRTSSFAVKGQPRNVRDTAKQLDVEYLVEGSVLREGGRLRINAQLIRSPDDIPLWSARYDRESKDIFTIQDEIARSIVNQLRLKLGRGRRRYETNLEAYDLYLQGRALIGRRGIPALEEGATLFEQALARDPSFAPAHAELANAYALMSAPTSSTMPFETAQAVIGRAAPKARDLDPLLAEAHMAMGWMYAREQDWPNADSAFRRAIELDPGLTEARTGYSTSTLQPLGKLDDALRVLHVALRNDPLSLEVQREIGIVHFLARRYEEAIAALRHVVSVDPDFPFAKSYLARALLFAGDIDEAIPLMESLDGRHLGRYKARNARRTPWLARAYVMAGRRGEAETLAGQYEDSPASVALVYAALGDTDRTFAALEQLAVVQPHQVPRLLTNPEMDGLHGDPRLAALRKRFGLQPE